MRNKVKTLFKMTIAFTILFFLSNSIQAQVIDSTLQSTNSAQRLLGQNQKLNIGGYAQIDYNQELNSKKFNKGNLDVHRLVLLFGYNYSERLKFITEIEFEHVKEVYVEQAFAQYKINNYVNLRAGLMLIPMGLINEYHEPPFYHGVERPYIDSYITPTTWRELGIGFQGNIIEASLKYQMYMVNGFISYDGGAKLNGKYGFRKGRQKGAESIINQPNFTGKVEFYGIRSMNIGLSSYIGKTQSTLYDDFAKDNSNNKAIADSSIVSLNMIGVDYRYSRKGLQLKAQVYYSKIGNSEAYNMFTNSDLGSSMLGYYIEASYNVFKPFSNITSGLFPFVRYSYYNTQQSMDGNISANPDYSNQIWTMGLDWKVNSKFVFKADFQTKITKTASQTNYFNAGVGLLF
jgi:hypothetical protein